MLLSLLLVAGHRHHQVPCHRCRNEPTAAVAGEARAGLSHHRQPQRQTRTTRAPAHRDHERQVRPQGHQTGPSWANPGEQRIRAALAGRPAAPPRQPRAGAPRPSHAASATPGLHTTAAKEPPPPHRGQREQIQLPSARIRTPPGWIQLLPAGTGQLMEEEVTINLSM
jgi:hypothetical protein